MQVDSAHLIFFIHIHECFFKIPFIKNNSAGYLQRSWRQRNLRQGNAGGEGDEKGMRELGSEFHCIDYLCCMGRSFKREKCIVFTALKVKPYSF